MERICLEKPIVTRHGFIPTRAVHSDINTGSVRDLSRGISVELGEPGGCGEVGEVLGGNLFVCVVGESSIGEGVPEEVAIDAVAGEVDIDAGSVFDVVQVGDAGVVRADLLEGEVEEAGDVAHVDLRGDIVRAKGKIATILAFGLQLEKK